MLCKHINSYFFAQNFDASGLMKTSVWLKDGPCTDLPHWHVEVILDAALRFYISYFRSYIVCSSEIVLLLILLI